MTALVCGSFAFDTIMVFEDKFRNHILPDKVHVLNVSFLVPEMRREFGGCAGNIAYNLNLLGGDVQPMGTVGIDFGPYAAWLDEAGVSRQYVQEVPNSYTAQAYITTDLDDNQITAFHPGAMNSAHQQQVPSDAGISIGIVSPDGRSGMLEHAEQFAAAGIPFMFDPGQGMPMFGAEELLRFIELADWIALNDYESEMLKEKTGLSMKQIAERVQAVVVTRGSRGSVIYANQKTIHIDTAPVTEVKDPTGCGDAYRAGLLFGLMNNWGWETTGRAASLMGAIKVASSGTQNHHFAAADFAELFKSAWGYDPTQKNTL